MRSGTGYNQSTHTTITGNWRDWIYIIFTIFPAVLVVAWANLALPSSQSFWNKLERDDDTYNLVRRVEFLATKPSSPQEERRVFVIGDSSIREGTDGRLLSRLLSAPVEKLAFAGGTPMESLLVAKKLNLHTGDCLVVGISPYEFKDDINTESSIFARPIVKLLLGFREAHRLLSKPTADILTQSVLRDSSFLYRYRQYVKEWFFGGYERGKWIEFRYKRRIDGRYMSLGLSDGSYELNSSNTTMGPAHLSYRSLNELQRFANSKGIKLLLVGAPINPIILDMDLMDDEVTGIYSRILGSYCYIDASEGLSDRDHFNDFTHLNSLGRKVFTRNLSMGLKAMWRQEGL